MEQPLRRSSRSRKRVQREDFVHDFSEEEEQEAQESLPDIKPKELPRKKKARRSSSTADSQPSSVNGAGLLDLPFDIYHLLAQYLQFFELYALVFSCKRLHLAFKSHFKAELDAYLCESCHKAVGFRRTTSQFLCFRCADELHASKYTILKLPKTIAKSRYKLNDGDLKPLNREYRDNPYSRRSAQMQLFKEEDLAQAALEKYGGVIGFIIHLAKSEKRSERLKESRQKRYEERQHRMEKRSAELSAALEARGLKLRQDSRLCSDYICGNETYSKEEIVDKMDEMRFFFTHTNYKTFQDQHWREFRQTSDSRSVDESDKVYISKRAKADALHQWIKQHKQDLEDEPIKYLKESQVPLSLHEQILRLVC